MPFGPELLMMVILLLSQTGGDMLDLIGTDAYWRNKTVTVTPEQLRQDAGPDADIANADAVIKDLASDDYKIRTAARQKLLDMGPAIIDKLKPQTESSDSEVATVAQQLVQQLSSTAQARPIRRLMAIRTLGERKDKDSVDLLKSLAKSSEPFVADYARRALARIDGKPYVRTFDDAAFAAELQSLPAHSTLAAQARTTLLNKPLTIDSVVDEFLKSAKEQMGDQPVPAGAANDAPKLPDRDKLIDKLTARWLKGLEAVGNIRVDALSLGAATEDPDNINLSLLIRGQYNPKALLAYCKANATEKDAFKLRTIAGVDALVTPDSSTLLLLSPERVLLVSGSTKEEHHAAVAESIVQRLGKDVPKEAANDGLDHDEQLAALLKAIDKRAIAWACGIVPKPMRSEESVKGFDTFSLHVLREKDLLRFVVKADGSDEDKVKTSVDALSDSLKDAIKQMHDEANREPMSAKAAAATITMLESMKIAHDAKSASITGLLNFDAFGPMIQEYIGMILGDMEEDETPPHGAPVPEDMPNPPPVPAPPEAPR